MRTWDAPDFYRPIAAPLDHCAELLGVDLATVHEMAANVEPLRDDLSRPEAVTRPEDLDDSEVRYYSNPGRR